MDARHTSVTYQFNQACLDTVPNLSRCLGDTHSTTSIQYNVVQSDFFVLAYYVYVLSIRYLNQGCI